MSFVQGAFIIIITGLLGFGSCFDLYSTVKYVFKKDDLKPEKSRHSLSEKWLEEIRAHKKKLAEQKGEKPSEPSVKTQPVRPVVLEPQEQVVKTGELQPKKVDTAQKVGVVGKDDKTKVIPELKVHRPESPEIIRKKIPATKIKALKTITEKPAEKAMATIPIEKPAEKAMATIPIEKPAEKAMATIPIEKPRPPSTEELPGTSVPAAPPQRRAVPVVMEGTLPRTAKARKWKGRGVTMKQTTHPNMIVNV